MSELLFLPSSAQIRLHGTWLPPDWIARQRKLPTPLAPQKLLQDKLHESRLQHFTSILFDRPSRRERSLAERSLLSLLWPAAVGSLVLGLCELCNAISHRSVVLPSTVQRGPRSLVAWPTVGLLMMESVGLLSLSR